MNEYTRRDKFMLVWTHMLHVHDAQLHAASDKCEHSLAHHTKYQWIKSCAVPGNQTAVAVATVTVDVVIITVDVVTITVDELLATLIVT